MDGLRPEGPPPMLILPACRYHAPEAVFILPVSCL